jgi:pimeloyl-ACP methyl ester carboxylesterase
MDAVGFEKPVVFGMSEGGTASIVFAAKRPERTRALILYGTYPFMATDWDDIDRDPVEVRERLISEAGEDLSGVGADYLPSTGQIARLQEMGRATRSGWGSGATAVHVPVSPVDAPARNVRAHVRKPGMVRATAESVFRIDIRSILATITVPTLVIHARRRHAGTVRPLPRRPHPARAVSGGRRRGPRALVHRSRHDPD